MADVKGEAGGRNPTMYRDDGSGTYSVATAANLWVYDTALLDYRKATVADLLASAASDETSTIYSGATALTPKFASIVASAGGATTVVAAVSLKKIRVVSYTLVANAAVNVKFQSHVTPTDKTGLLYLAANGGVSSAYCPVGLFETVSGEALDINLSGAVAVGGHLTYIEV